MEGWCNLVLSTGPFDTSTSTRHNADAYQPISIHHVEQRPHMLEIFCHSYGELQVDVYLYHVGLVALG